MYKAIVAGNWGLRERHGEIGPFPQLVIDYPPSPDMLKCKSASQTAANVPSDPPLNVWAIVCSQSTLDAIEADPNYWVEFADEIVEEEA